MPIAAHRALRTTARGLIAALFLLAFGRAGQSEAQALIKVSDSINFKVGLLLQTQADFQETANATNDATGGYQQNIMLRRARLIIGGQVAKNVFFYVDTENSNLGKSTQTLASGATGIKAPGTGFNLLDAVGEWRISKEFNIQAGAILVPVNRWIVTSSGSTFMLDQSAYNLPSSTPLQNNAGRDTGVMFRGYLFCDRLEYRSLVLSGFRQPGVKNAPRFTERLQYNFFDTEVYNFPSYAGVNYGKKKILALGAAYDTEGDYRIGSADLYLDIPIDVGSFESTVAYQYIKGGTLIPTLPEENTFSIEAGVFLKKAKIAPIVRYEQKTFNQTINESKNENRFVAGLNYYPIPGFENNFNIKFWWQRVNLKTGYATSQFTVQMQVFYF
jgi:Phosphate-selective porin O and P